MFVIPGIYPEHTTHLHCHEGLSLLIQYVQTAETDTCSPASPKVSQKFLCPRCAAHVLLEFPSLWMHVSSMYDLIYIFSSQYKPTISTHKESRAGFEQMHVEEATAAIGGNERHILNL